MRKSVRDFASLLGIEATTVVNWRTGLGGVKLRSGTQGILDTTLDRWATADDRARFEQIVAEGEAVWRQRHRGATEATSLTLDRTAVSASPVGESTSTVDPPMPFREFDREPGKTEEHNDSRRTGGLIDVLRRIHQLSRSINPEVIQHLRDSTLHNIAHYETLDPTALLPDLQQQRIWLDELIDECSHPDQRRQLYEIACATSGLLGYIATGRGEFPLARAYCRESLHLGDHAQDRNLEAWARGLQSFCEYYAGRYDDALRYAEQGLAVAQDGPQAVRLAVNCAARASGKLGNVGGVHRAVAHAYELLSYGPAPDGVPSSISLDSYSPAQAAGNAATAYLSLAMPDRVEHYVALALPEMNGTNSPWGRSLVMIDSARSHLLSEGPDLDMATDIMLDALALTPGRPGIQMQRRATEFIRAAEARWGSTTPVAEVRDALASAANPR
ncbi:tetratricopeptide repeat protein [Nocardia macrotermitis]|nr:tetratricopeptide repeat protein [Nocardia macrotermitis]